MNNDIILDRAKWKRQQNIFLIISAVIVVLLLLIPQLKFVAHVFNLFTTIIHESGHTVVNLLVGNKVDSIFVNVENTSGWMTYSGVQNPFAVSAGYIGSTLLGGLLLILSAYHKISKIVLRILGALLIVIAFLFMLKQLPTFFLTLAFAGAFIGISFIKDKRVSAFTLIFLSVQLIVNAFFDIITLIRISMGSPSTGGKSDALVMSEITFGTEWFWAGVYLIISLVIFVIAFRINRNIITSNYSNKIKA